MNIKEELNKLLIGYKIKHPKEELSQILSKILINDKIYDFFKAEDNFFEINEIKKINKKEIIKTMYKTWCSYLDDHDYFSFSKNYIIFIKDKTVNIVGHIEIEDLNNIKSELVEKIKNKNEMHAVFYPIYSPDTYTIDGIDGVKINVNNRGKIKTNYEITEYGSVEERDISYMSYRSKIYYLTKKYLEEENIKEEELEMIINALSKEYVKTIDITKVLKNNGFTIFKSLQEITNVKSLKLQNKVSGKLLEGKIDISVDRGYQTHPEKTQQDSALSTVKNENIFLNIIADGAGCSAHGKIASALFVSELKKWFEIIPDELLNDIDIMTELLKQKIIEIDKKIEMNYKKSYTTFVLALTINDKTIISNIGDSHAYTYENEELIELTTQDSDSKGMSYEDARYNSWNNMITAAIGDGYKKDIHINIINNEGQKIILSSDGITDLVSEERFKSYFINDISSSQMIEDALSKKYTKRLRKDEDNISVIVIKLPDYTQKKLVK